MRTAAIAAATVSSSFARIQTHQLSGSSLFSELIVDGLGFSPAELETFFANAIALGCAQVDIPLPNGSAPLPRTVRR